MLTGKRVVIVLPRLELGGAERQALLLARYLKHQQGSEVEVWGLNQPGRVSELCDEYAIPWRVVQMSWSADRAMRLKAWARFTRELRRARPDVILPYSMRPNVICGSVWRWTGARACVWNQRDEGRGDRVGRGFQRFTVRRVPFFLSNSEHGREFLVGQLGAQPERVRVVYNGIETPAPQADRQTWRNRLAIGAGDFVACMAANLHNYKDHATLLKAWQLVTERLGQDGRRAVLLLAGRHDDTYEALQTFARDLGLGEGARFLGKVNDVAGLIGAADIGVFSSLYEGCPNGVLECMASGLAVVATDIPGIREAVGEDGYPYLSRPADAADMAEKIVGLAMSPSLRAGLGSLNRQRIETTFSPQRMCRESAELIGQCL